MRPINRRVVDLGVIEIRGARSLRAERSSVLYLQLGKSDGAVAVIHQFWKHLAEDLELAPRQTREQRVAKLPLQWRAVTNDQSTAS